MDTYTDEEFSYDAFVKLGMSLYLHSKLAEDAKKAEEAVAYLKEPGVFTE